MRTRRAVLRTGALTGVGTILAIVALPSPPDSTPIDRTVEAGEPPGSVTDWTDETVSDEDRTRIARYQYRPTTERVEDRTDRNAFVATAPINVVLVPDSESDTAALERVVDVLEAEGWVRSAEEYTRFAWDRTNETFVPQQATAAESYYGTSGRLHVRCWSFEGIVSIQAHEDTGARPKHGIASYERGRRAMEAIYDAAGWDVSPTAIDLDNDQRDYDGVASVITESVNDER